MGATLQKIVCKTVGIAGMSAIAYDAYTTGKASSARIAQASIADRFEKIHADTNTTTTESPLNSAMQQKVAEIRMNNPIIPVYTKVKGFTKGVLTTLGNNIIPVTFAGMALAGKGFFAKLGAWGVGLYGVYTIAKEGFGFGKSSPMN